MDLLLGKEIGRGGFGTVYVNKKNPSQCIKVSNKSGHSCRQWSNEYKKIKSFVKSVKKHPIYKKLDMIRIVIPTKFINTSSNCYMVLPRIFRPEGKNSDDYTIQSQIGHKSIRINFKGRGEFIGLEQIREYMNKIDLEISCFEIGVMMALIHHIGKNDCYDVELYLGKEERTRKCRFYLADFDMSEEVKTYNEETIERLVWSLDAVPYFPKKSVDPKLFELFKNGYSTIAPPEIVEKIFENYE